MFRVFKEEATKGITVEEREYSEETSLEIIWRRDFQTEGTVKCQSPEEEVCQSGSNCTGSWEMSAYRAWHSTLLTVLVQWLVVG